MFNWLKSLFAFFRRPIEPPQRLPTPIGTNRQVPSNYPYKVIDKGSKIGIHSIRPNNNLAHIRNAKGRGAIIPVVKSVNDIDWLIDVKAIDPNIITIARLTTPDEGLQRIEDETNMRRRADYLFAPILEKLILNPDLRDAVDYWEICNEPDPPHHPPDTLGYTKLGECMIACIERAAELDLKLALLGLNAGTPEWIEIVDLVETGVFGKAQEGGHILTLHEGVFKDGNTGTWPDPVDLWWPSLIPGSPYVEGAGALCFRYRYIYSLLKERNEVIPLVVSEIVYGGGYNHDGGSPVDTVSRADWYDQEGSKDYFLWSHLPFTLGSRNNDADEWRLRDYEFAMPSLLDYMVAQRDRQNAEAPPTEPPPPPPEDPRPFKAYMPVIVQNNITTEPIGTLGRIIVANLAPANATLEEKRHILSETEEEKETLLQSAELAIQLTRQGIAGSTIRIWGPNRWQGNLTQKLAEDGIIPDPQPLTVDGQHPSHPIDQAIGVVHAHLLPQELLLAEKFAVLDVVNSTPAVILQSADDAVEYVRLGTIGSRVTIWAPERWQGDIVKFFTERGVSADTRAIPPIIGP